MSIVNIFSELHILTCFGRVETMAILYLRAAVLQQHRSVIPGRPNCVTGRVNETIFYPW